MAKGLSKTDEKTVQKHLEAIDCARKNYNDSVVLIGEHLAAIQEILPSGEFVPFVGEHCRFSKATAYAYIAAYKEFGSFQRLEWIDSGSIYALSRCPAAAKRAKDLANHGTRIDDLKAKELVKEANSAKKNGAPKRGTKPPGQPSGSTAAPASASNGASTPAPAKETPDVGGYEPDEAKKPLKALETSLSKAARDWADVKQVLGPSAELKAVYDGIDTATRALAQFRRTFKRQAK